MQRGITQKPWELYQDTGCNVAPACLECPLETCKYDSGARPVSSAQRDRNAAIRKAIRMGKSTTREMAAQWEISERTIFRIIKES